ncbi:MAG: exopolysaccharide biosynthesis polyprenyl glycosylphosphotransferase [Lachnospiraceae bacterium]|nr:exopolysaccharide biosynthesis polyprenyl glycosylphosphotransferase [Lachnospiraceae bacterium]
MEKRIRRLLAVTMPLIGLLVETAIYAYTWFSCYNRTVSTHVYLYRRGHILVLTIYFILIYFFSHMYGSNNVGVRKPGDVAVSHVFAVVIVNGLSYFQLSLMANWLLDVVPILLMTLADIVFETIWAYLSDVMYRNAFPPRHLVLIHGSRPFEEIREKFISRSDLYAIDDDIDISEGLDAVKEMLKGPVGGVVLWDIPSNERNALLKYLYGQKIRIYMMPKISDVIVKGSVSMHLFDTPVMMTKEYSLTTGQKFLKRVIDLTCAVLLLIISSPVMIIAAIAVKACDGGPVFYKQRRCTENRREFDIIKFRSMGINAERDGVARLASKNDSRVTPVGKFIRRYRIDELPQLFNIIRGDMSFIGPRPERPEIIDRYMETMPEFAFRMRVRAGLAGYAQVYGKYNTTPYDKLKLDLTYIENYSVWMDIKLMLLTLRIVLKPESTEGVDENKASGENEDSRASDARMEDVRSDDR